MKSFLLLFCSTLVVATGTPLLAADRVGVREIVIASPERGRDLSVTVWYPARAGGQKTLVGDNKVFAGTPAFANAPLADGRFPLVLVSHGSGGRVQAMGWITTRLVEAGFIVAGPNHPGTTSGDSTPIDTPKLWERALDLSTLTTALTTGAPWRDSIDKERIGVLGFSLGGAAAMEIVGARASLESYARYCDNHKTMADCAWYAGGKGFIDGEAIVAEKVDLRAVDKTRFEQSNLDRRIKSAVIVDPALAQAYDAQSLKEIAIPAQFINLGGPGTVPVGAIADKLSKLTPQGQYAQVNDATHFSFLAECKEGGAALLRTLGEPDPICDDGGSRTRADIHEELRELITAAFTRALKDEM